jgi:Subtilase family
MANRQTAGGTFVWGVLLAGALGAAAPGAAQELGPKAQQQLRAIYADKASWTTAQRKLATSLLYASRRSRGLAMVQGIAPMSRIADRAGVDRDGMVVVHIRGEVTDALLQKIAEVGGRVAAALPAQGLVRARVPVGQVETIAGLPEVRSIRPPGRFLRNEGSKTTEGDVAHAAATARTVYGIDGTGVRVGILSTGVDTLAARQATGDLPPTCATPPGTGSCVKVVVPQCDAPPCGYDDGTAMMEIIHDLAPKAQLYFAGTDPNAAEEEFAANILTLRNTYGCDVIVDDVTFFAEGAFQDGPIAQAVSAVKNAGALYFSSAGNAGRYDAGTSGTWESDFLNSGTRIAAISDYYGGDLPIHSFNGLTGASAANSDQLKADADFAITLKWSDPLGAATNDYDIFILDSGLTQIWDGSVDDQGITREPYEEMGFGFTNERIVVVRFGHVVTPGQPAVPGGGAARALRLDTNWGQLYLATPRATFGHNAGEAAVTVAAASVTTAGGGAFTGGSANPVENFSSDGRRRLFYNPNGTAITPGNVLFGTGGGRDVQKPDITAADCVTTTTPGFTPFCGTSAAAAHAAGIAALLKSAPNHPGGGQVLAALMTTALDVTPVTGWDRNSGVGIVMANAAAAAMTTLPALDFYTASPCRVVDTRQSGGALSCGTPRAITMVGGTCDVPTGAKAVSVNVTVTEASATGNLKVYAADAPAPSASTLNYVAGVNRANNAVSPLNASGQMAVLCSPAGTAHVIVDVNGYFK